MRSGDEEEEKEEKGEKEEQKEEKQATNIKSNNPHLAGREKIERCSKILVGGFEYYHLG